MEKLKDVINELLSKSDEEMIHSKELDIILEHIFIIPEKEAMNIFNKSNNFYYGYLHASIVLNLIHETKFYSISSKYKYEFLKDSLNFFESFEDEIGEDITYPLAELHHQLYPISQEEESKKLWSTILSRAEQIFPLSVEMDVLLSTIVKYKFFDEIDTFVDKCNSDDNFIMLDAEITLFELLIDSGKNEHAFSYINNRLPLYDGADLGYDIKELEYQSGRLITLLERIGKKEDGILLMNEFRNRESDELENYKNIYLEARQKLDSKQTIRKESKPIPNLRKSLISLKKSLDKNSPRAEAVNLKKCFKALAYNGNSKRVINLFMKQLRSDN